MKKNYSQILAGALLFGFTISVGQISPSNNQKNHSVDPSSPLNVFETSFNSTYLSNKKEIVSKRDLFTKHYDLGNGTYQAVISSGPVHFPQNGKLEEIRTKWVESGNSQYPYENRTNFMTTQAGNKLQEGIISTTSEGTVKEFTHNEMYWEVNGQKLHAISGANVSPIVEGNKLTYKNIFGNIDAQYTILAGKRKLDYIIPNKQALGNIPNGANYLVFAEKLILPYGWNYTQTEKGVKIKDTQGKTIYLLDRPTTNDVKDFGLFNHNTSMSVSKVGNELTILTKVEVSWLKSNEREYPVMVDPTTTVYPDNADFWTVQFNSAGGGQSGLPAAGRASSGTWYRGFITFNTSSIPASTIENAQIALTNVNVAGTINAEYPIGITQSNYDLPVWAETYSEMYDFVTHPANMAGDYVAITNPGGIGTTNTFTLGNQGKLDIAMKTGSANSFFSVSLRQGWDGGEATNRYIVFGDHTYGTQAPKLILTYTQSDIYCHPAHIYANCAALGDCQYIGIGKVEFNTLVSNTAYDNIPIGYNLLPATTTVTQGQSHVLKVTYKDNGSPANSGKIGAWIDWNEDGDFDDNGEFIGITNLLTNNGTHSFNVFIPNDATPGTARLRLRSVYADEELTANDWCNSKEYGETEDYNFTVEALMNTSDLSANSIEIYPNPTSGILNINATKAVQKIVIYSLNGQVVMSGKSNQLNISNLPKGTYLISITTSDQKTTTQKFVKN